jgi:hypothetical protein
MMLSPEKEGILGKCAGCHSLHVDLGKWLALLRKRPNSRNHD